jgi:purine-nucleoside phosphorylase
MSNDLTSVSTPHISNPPVPFAKTVLMPGDPLRSEYMAKNTLKALFLSIMSGEFKVIRAITTVSRYL